MESWSEVSTPANGQRRKKPMTYGRAARNTTFTPQSVGSFYDHGTPNPRQFAPTPRPKTLTRPSSLQRRAPVHQPTAKDDFDVPSSDNDSPAVTERPDRDEFDVPVSDNERTLRRSKAKKLKTSTPNTKTTKLTTHFASKSRAEQKRKSPAELPASKRTRTSSPALPTNDHENLVTPNEKQDMGSKVTQLALSQMSAAEKLNARRIGRTQTQQSPISSGLSAPARLSRMVSEDSSEDNSLGDCDRLSTPPPRPLLKRAVSSTTPKQSQLWSQLLSSDPVEQTADMTESTSRTRPQQHRPLARKPGPITSTPYTVVDGTVTQSSRLVDRLKQTVHGDYDADDFTGDSDQESGLADSPSSGPSINDDERPSTLTRSQGTSGSQLTYAQQRSYLQAETLEDSLLASITGPPPAPTRLPAASHRSVQASKMKPMSAYDAASDSDDGAATAIRSIHELRAAGSKKRFLDDNAALFGDIKDHALPSRSRRRSALMELATKLFDEPFLKRFVEHGFDRELAGEFCLSYVDTVADAVLCSLLVQISHNAAAAQAVSRLYKAGALNVATRCLAVTGSLSRAAKDRRNNMSKVAQSSLQDFCNTFCEASVWGSNKPDDLTFPLLGLKCFELVVLHLRRQGDKDSLLPLSVVGQLVDLVVGGVEPRTLSIEQKLALSILELASTSTTLVNTWPAQSWKQIVSDLPYMLNLAEGSKAQVLKLCINLTNENARNCGICSQTSAIRAISQQIMEGFGQLHTGIGEEEHLSRRDTLVLTTGLMTNLVEFSHQACEEIVALPDEGLASMVRVFLQGLEQAEEAQSEQETHSNVAYGFLAVLLGNLCQNPSARDKVRACMPEKKLQPLVNAIDEFAQYNQKVDSQAFDSEEGKDVWQRFTGKLMAVAARIQQYEV